MSRQKKSESVKRMKRNRRKQDRRENRTLIEISAMWFDKDAADGLANYEREV
jgi:hypothetical protein